LEVNGPLVEGARLDPGHAERLQQAVAALGANDVEVVHGLLARPRGRWLRELGEPLLLVGAGELAPAAFQSSSRGRAARSTAAWIASSREL
jgi:hypothetical protein